MQCIGAGPSIRGDRRGEDPPTALLLPCVVCHGDALTSQGDRLVPQQTHQRLHLACEQLDVAVELFLAGRSATAVLILARAAEDMLAKVLVARGDTASIDDDHCAVAIVQDFIVRNGSAWHAFISEKNRSHLESQDSIGQSPAMLTADLDDAGLWMLVRACDNYQRLALRPTARLREFERWFKESMVSGEALKVEDAPIETSTFAY